MLLGLQVLRSAPVSTEGVGAVVVYVLFGDPTATNLGAV